MPIPQPTGLLSRLAAVFGRLCRAVEAQWPAPGPIPPDTDRAALSLSLAAFFWLNTLADRVGHLVIACQTGTLRPVRPRRPTPPPAPGSPAAAADWLTGRTPALPAGFGWLARTLADPAPQAVAVTALLKDPELQPLFAAEPARFGRLLRPFCRAMGLAPPEPIREAPKAPGDAPRAAPKAAPKAPPPKPARRPAPPSPTLAPPPVPATLRRPPEPFRRADLLLGASPLAFKIA